jgi:lipoyl(octanoyl) transferase
MLKIIYKNSTGLVDYHESLQMMEDAVANEQSELRNAVWFLEHPSLYTSGASARSEELLDAEYLPVYKTNRGGKFTYHGPGQRIVYLVLDLKKIFSPAAPDAKKYVFLLEETIIEVLKEFGLIGLRIKDNAGVWVKASVYDAPKKIAFIGIRIRKWIAYHGIAFNISPNLEHFKGIIPCGLKEYGITSLKELNIEITPIEFDVLFKKHFEKLLSRGL